MTATDITNLITNNGVAVAMVIYFMVYNSSYINKMNNTLTEMTKAITELTKTVEEMRKEVRKSD